MTQPASNKQPLSCINHQHGLIYNNLLATQPSLVRIGLLHLTLDGSDKLERQSIFTRKDKLSQRKAFTIVKDFLQPDSNVHIDSVVNDLLDILPDDAQSHDTWEWGQLCLELAEQIPYNHPSQIKLARIVEHTGRSTKLQIKTISPDGRPTWLLYPRLGESLQDNLPNAPPDDNPMEYVNYHAFAVRLFEFRIMRDDPTFALHILRESLEDELDPDYRPDIMVMGAAQWILWYGQTLFTHVLWYGEPSADEERSWAFGPLFEGKRLLGLDRWTFWRNAFRKAAVNQSYATECCMVAGKAADLMVAIEKGSSS